MVDAEKTLTLDAGENVNTRSGAGTQLSGKDIDIEGKTVAISSATDDVEFISHGSQSDDTSTTIVSVSNLMESSFYC